MQEKETKKVQNGANKSSNVKEQKEKVKKAESKVETKQNATKSTVTKEEKNKKHGIGEKIFKFILIVIAILAVAYVIIVVRNYFLLQDIAAKVKQYEYLNDYSYTIKTLEGNVENEQAVIAKKGNIVKATMKVDEKNLIIWKDSLNKNTCLVNQNDKIIIEDKNNKIIFDVSNVLTDMFSGIGENYKWMALSTIIYTEKLNGEECYVIDMFGNKVWYNKETGLLSKRKDGYVVKQNGEKLPIYTEYTNWKLNTVTDEEVAKPSYFGYTVKKAN